MDAVVLLAALPVDFRFVAKRELGPTPVIATIIRKVGHVTVERADPAQSAVDAARASAVLRGGVSLLFFPEGTFRRPGLLSFRLGAFKAAVEGGRRWSIGLRQARDPARGHLAPWPGRVTVAIGPRSRPRAETGRKWCGYGTSHAPRSRVSPASLW